MSDFLKINPFQDSDAISRSKETQGIPSQKGNSEMPQAEKEFGVAPLKNNEDDKIATEFDSKAFDADFSNLDFSSFDDKGKNDANLTGSNQDVTKKDNNY